MEAKGISIPRRCSQCDNKEFAQYYGNVDFCSRCRAPLQRPLSLNEALAKEIKAGPLIYQKQPDNFFINTTAGELRFYNFHVLHNGLNYNGSIDIALAGTFADAQMANPNNGMYLASPRRYWFRSWFLDALDIQYTYWQSGGQLETLYDILRALIEFGVTDPVCIAEDNIIYMQASRDCLTNKCPDNTDIQLRFLSRRTEDQLRYHGVTQEYINHIKLTEAYYGLLQLSKSPLALDQSRWDQQTKENWDQWTTLVYPYASSTLQGFRDSWKGGGLTPSWFQSQMSNRKGAVDGIIFSSRIHLEGPSLAQYLNLFGTAPPPLPLVEIPKISEEYLALRNALAQITEDVYYSKRTKELYSLDQLQTLFRSALDVFGQDLDNTFRAGSKNLRILNVNTYTLSPVYDALFTFSDLQQALAPLASINGNRLTYPALLYLLGLNSNLAQERLFPAPPPLITPFETKRSKVPAPPPSSQFILPSSEQFVQPSAAILSRFPKSNAPPIPPKPKLPGRK